MPNSPDVIGPHQPEALARASLTLRVSVPQNHAQPFSDTFADLAECSAFRQTLLARPPGIIHGTAGLLGLLLGTAVLWSAVTEADLVVRVGGRVRPRSLPQQVVYGAGGETFRTPAEGRVVAVAV